MYSFTRKQLKDLTDEKLIEIANLIFPELKGMFRVSKKYTECDSIYECIAVYPENGEHAGLVQFLWGEQYGNDPQYLITSFDADWIEGGLTEDVIKEIVNIINKV